MKKVLIRLIGVVIVIVITLSCSTNVVADDNFLELGDLTSSTPPYKTAMYYHIWCESHVNGKWFGTSIGSSMEWDNNDTIRSYRDHLAHFEEAGTYDIDNVLIEGYFYTYMQNNYLYDEFHSEYFTNVTRCYILMGFYLNKKPSPYGGFITDNSCYTTAEIEPEFYIGYN